MAAHERDIENMVGGKVTAHMSLMLVWVVANALPLHSAGALARWQEQLTHYYESRYVFVVQ